MFLNAMMKAFFYDNSQEIILQKFDNHVVHDI